MSTFYTDVIQHSKLYNSTSRVASLELLEPVFRQKVQAIVADAAAHGRTLLVFETYRSQKRQQELFKQGVTKLQAVGVHHYGLAADIVYVAGGEPSWKGDFSFLGQLAHSHQLIWGGDWGYPQVRHSFSDPDHVQWCTVGQQAALFRGEWYPAADYNPYQALHASHLASALALA